jgi:hypothetical protein
MSSVKYSFDGEVYRTELPVADGAQISFSQLASTARTLFNITDPVILRWTDDEGEIINCTSDVEVAEALRNMTSQKMQCFKFDVVVRPGKAADEGRRQQSSRASRKKSQAPAFAVNPHSKRKDNSESEIVEPVPPGMALCLLVEYCLFI